MLPAVEVKLGASVSPVSSGDADEYRRIELFATRSIEALSSPDPLLAAFGEISDDILVRYGLRILLNVNIAKEEKYKLLAELEVSELQDLIDNLFSTLYSRDANPLLLSDFLARIWLSTQLFPSQLRAQDIIYFCSYPFATTPTSNIHKGVLADGLTTVAMKTFRRSQTRPASEEDIKRFFFEAMILFTSNHPNIIPFLGIYVDPSGYVYLVAEFRRNGTLSQYLLENPQANIPYLLEKVAKALTYLHSLPAPVLHGDLRGMNVLIGDDGRPLLIDMGLSLVMDPLTMTFSPESHLFAGNPRWTPLEKFRRSDYPLTLKADSFSFASLMLEVFSGEVPYRYLNSDSAVVVEVAVRRRLPDRPDHPQLTDALWDLMMKCWSLDPVSRPSMEEVHCAVISACSESTIVVV